MESCHVGTHEQGGRMELGAVTGQSLGGAQRRQPDGARWRRPDGAWVELGDGSRTELESGGRTELGRRWLDGAQWSSAMVDGRSSMARRKPSICEHYWGSYWRPSFFAVAQTIGAPPI
jgi:hypothetical protein